MLEEKDSKEGALRRSLYTTCLVGDIIACHTGAIISTKAELTLYKLTQKKFTYVSTRNFAIIVISYFIKHHLTKFNTSYS